MDPQLSGRVRLSFKNATIFITILNVIAALYLLQFFFFSSVASRNRLSSNQFTSALSNNLSILYNNLNTVQLKYIKESEEMRLAMQPLELIKRVREIQQEVNGEPGIIKSKDAKQTAAVDLSKRLKDMHSVNDAANLKALEEWRKRKMERARQRQLEKNGTATSQA